MSTLSTPSKSLWLNVMRSRIHKQRNSTGSLKTRLSNAMELLEESAMAQFLNEGDYLMNCKKLKDHYENVSGVEKNLEMKELLLNAIDDPKQLWKHDEEQWHSVEFLSSLFHNKERQCREDKVDVENIWIKNVVDVFCTQEFFSTDANRNTILAVIYSLCCKVAFRDKVTMEVMHKLREFQIHPEVLFPEEDYGDTDDAGPPYCTAETILEIQPLFIYYMCHDARRDGIRGYPEVPDAHTRRLREVAFESLLPSVYTEDQDLARYIGVQHNKPPGKDFWVWWVGESHQRGANGSKVTI